MIMPRRFANPADFDADHGRTGSGLRAGKSEGGGGGRALQECRFSMTRKSGKNFEGKGGLP